MAPEPDLTFLDDGFQQGELKKLVTAYDAIAVQTQAVITSLPQQADGKQIELIQGELAKMKKALDDAGSGCSSSFS
jgi:hypothetical protein